jgi:hypothetical protein
VFSFVNMGLPQSQFSERDEQGRPSEKYLAQQRVGRSQPISQGNEWIELEVGSLVRDLFGAHRMRGLQRRRRHGCAGESTDVCNRPEKTDGEKGLWSFKNNKSGSSWD